MYEEITDLDLNEMREPIPRFLDPASGILCVHFIGLRPPFRGVGLGREVMRELVRVMADPRVGLVLLNSIPLQHMPHGYDDFDEEVRELPWNSPEEDQEALMGFKHSVARVDGRVHPSDNAWIFDISGTAVETCG